ncbi:MAG: hypothetical protein C0609_00155 [Deltaproteobacteria bacterium]|nr:MAG: hypothetical protein C0609_00155 [Deltaproteobacteria bacterium]
MKRVLGAKEVYSNIQKLKGFRTKRELADFFCVSPSAISDWVNRNKDTIPAKKLAEASHRHNIRWQWLSYGELPPYEEKVIERSTGIELAPSEVELLGKIKGSPAFRQAVERMMGLDEHCIKLVASVAQSMGERNKETAKKSVAADSRVLREKRKITPFGNHW